MADLVAVSPESDLAALSPESDLAAVSPGSSVLLEPFEARVIAAVRRYCTRDPEFILNAIGDDVRTEGAVRRVIRSVPGLFEISRPRAPHRKRTQESGDRMYSTITAGKFPSDVNYAGRVFQLDLVFLPHIVKRGGMLVVDAVRYTIPVLTCVCVASRHAFVRRTRSKRGVDVYAKMKEMLAEIYTALDRGMELDAERVRAGYYTERAFEDRCTEAHARREAARLELERAGRTDRNGRLVLARTARYFGLLAGSMCGPFRDEWREWPDEPFVRSLSLGLPVDRKLQAAFSAADDAAHRGENWLVDLADMQLRSDADAADIAEATGLVDQGALDARADRREVTAPWHRVHPHVTFVTDDGEFGHAQRNAFKYALARGYPAPHWCTVNKSDMPRKGVQIVERFHRTLRAMWAVALTMQTDVDVERNVDHLLETRIPATYNATRSRSTMRTPDEMWALGVDGTAQRAKIGMRGAFPVGTLVTIPSRTAFKESHRVVYRRDDVYRVVGKNVYTREIARYGGDEEGDQDGELELALGPIAPHELRLINKRGAASLERMRAIGVSVPREVRRVADGAEAVRERQNLGAERRSVFQPLLVDAERARLVIESGDAARVPPRVAELRGLTVEEALTRAYVDESGAAQLYDPMQLERDLQAGFVALGEPACPNGACKRFQRPLIGEANAYAQYNPDTAFASIRFHADDAKNARAYETIMTTDFDDWDEASRMLEIGPKSAAMQSVMAEVAANRGLNVPARQRRSRGPPKQKGTNLGVL
jgi:hypothetical protein